MSHNKTLAAQLYSEFKEFFPAQRRPLLRQLLRLLPARGLHPAARHLHRERRLDQPGDRPPAAGRHQRPGEPPRRDHRGQRVVHLRPGLARGLPRDDGRPAAAARRSTATRCSRKLVDIQYERNDIEFQPGKFRVRGDCVEIWPSLRGVRLPRRVLGRRGRAALAHPSHQRRGDRAAARSCSSIRPSTSSCPRSASRAAIDEIKRELEERLEELKRAGKLLEAHRLNARTRFDIEMMQEVGYCPGIENYSRPLSGPAAGHRRPTRCSASFPRITCCSSTSRTSRCRRSAACTPATTTAR